MEETGEPIRQGRIAYGVSGLLIVALLLSTVVMLNNYGELKILKVLWQELVEKERLRLLIKF